MAKQMRDGEHNLDASVIYLPVYGIRGTVAAQVWGIPSLLHVQTRRGIRGEIQHASGM